MDEQMIIKFILYVIGLVCGYYFGRGVERFKNRQWSIKHLSARIASYAFAGGRKKKETYNVKH
jgi:hypothetical protein